MRSFGLRLTLVLAAGLAILAIVLFVASTVDARPPEVATYRLTLPRGDDARVALTTSSVEVSFSELVDHESAAAAFRIVPNVAGTTSWSGSTLIFTPAQPLPLETAFVVRVEAGVMDAAGNRSTDAAEPFEFATAGPPRVTASDPEAGADEVELGATIAVTFSSIMDTASVERALQLVPAVALQLRWSGEVLEVIPTNGLESGRSYRLEIDRDATDVAGVALEDGFVLEFETITPVPAVEALVPADGTNGISVQTPIAIVFDRPLDPASVSADLIELVPDLAGTLELIADAPDETDDARTLRFTPSAALPPTTTFEVRLLPGLRARDGGTVVDETTWTFTTGAPMPTLSNQIVFLSARSGIVNLWAMNADGTGQRQLSSELTSVTDYAISPDGRSFVVGDGRSLVQQRADGSSRQVLTDEGSIEFDPTFSPDGRWIAFARADDSGGAGRGLWEHAANGGEERRVELPGEIDRSGEPVASGSPDATDDEPSAVLRAPRYSPDGQSLAFVDPTGRIGIVELPGARLTTAPFVGLGAPVWLPDSSGIVISGIASAAPAGSGRVGSVVPPLEEEQGEVDRSEAVIGFLSRSGTAVETTFEEGAAFPAFGAAGRIGFIRLDDGGAAGQLHLADGIGRTPRLVELTASRSVSGLAFAPEGDQLSVALASDDASAIWLLDLDADELTSLSDDGWRPRWLP